MPIKRVGDFFESDDLGIVHSLGVESCQLMDCVAEINRRKIRGVFGCSCFGFHETDLDFLRDLSSIRQVWFWEIDLTNIDGLYEHDALEYFGVSSRRPAINFSSFPRLHDAVWHPIKNDQGLNELNELQRLAVWRYKPKTKRLAELSLPLSLQKLDFNWCNLENIEGLMELPNLVELQFHYCRNLASLQGISKIAPNLKKLVVTRCANLREYHETNDMVLEHLYINIRGKEVAKKSVRGQNRT